MRAAVPWLAVVFGMAMASGACAADQRAVVEGLVVNFGIMSAEQALRADGHSDAHPANPPGGSQHLLVTLDDSSTGRRISDAEVDVVVTDPRGRTERKRMLHTQAAGLPDYSELFVFGWSGKYSVQVVVTPTPGVKPIRTRFTVDHRV